MARSVAKIVVMAAATVGLAFLGAGTATAADSGQHVRTCAQQMGFDGIHNPGTHQGFTGWDPNHVC